MIRIFIRILRIIRIIRILFVDSDYNSVFCFFCQKNIQEIDFKNTELLRHFLSGLGKIRPKKRTGVCSKHQRKLAKTIKRARQVGLL